MKISKAIWACLFVCFFHNFLYAQPWYGTVFKDPDILKDSEYNVYKNTTYIGIEKNNVWDYRTGKFQVRDCYSFVITYIDNLTTNAFVNLEYGSVELARVQAEKYAFYAGLLPAFFRKDIKELELHKGKNSIGAGSGAITIHTDLAEDHIRGGHFEETMIHEATHLTLGDQHTTPEWNNAKNADGAFISTYAQENPTTEDISESIVPWIALRYRRDRISETVATYIKQTIPNRIAYFDRQNYDLGTLMLNTPPVACEAANNITVTNATERSTTISWSMNGATSFYIYYRQIGKNWILAVDHIAANSYTFNNLTPDTTYEVDVYSRCTNEIPVSDRFAFQTAAPSLSINNATNPEKSFTLFPIPATKFLTVQFDTRTSKEVTIYNLEGKQIYTKKHVTNTLEVAVDALKKGNYLLLVKGISGYSTRMFTVD